MKFHRRFCQLEFARHSAELRRLMAGKGPTWGVQGARASAQGAVFLNTEDVGLQQQDEIMHLGWLLERRQGCSSPGLRKGPPEQRGDIQKRAEGQTG